MMCYRLRLLLRFGGVMGCPSRKSSPAESTGTSTGLTCIPGTKSAIKGLAPITCLLHPPDTLVQPRYCMFAGYRIRVET